MDVIITVLEGEEDHPCNMRDGIRRGRTGGWGMMSILSGCITVASAAIIDAGIDCVDIVTGGVAAVVRRPTTPLHILLDPCPSDHGEIVAACVIGYLQARDEVTEVWAKGSITAPPDSKGAVSIGIDSLVDQAVEAAMAARLVLIEAIKESTQLKIQRSRIDQPEDAAVS